MDTAQIITIAVVVGVIVLIFLLVILLYCISLAKEEVPSENGNRHDQEKLISPLVTSKRFNKEDVIDILDWMRALLLESGDVELQKVEGYRELLLTMMSFKEKYSENKGTGMATDSNCVTLNGFPAASQIKEQDSEARINVKEQNALELADDPVIASEKGSTRSSSSCSSYSGGDLQINYSITPPQPTRKFNDLPNVHDKKFDGKITC